ncbi:MAG: 30S ribosomal protein S20 [Candidatus Omnitrophica bacterium]|nr:30S ribosomal protein S20 [Candidatus Omnitrophota bacterium]
MPQRKTSKKDLKQNKKRKLRNLQVKEKIKAAIKKFKKSLDNKDAAAKNQALMEMCRTLDKAASKKVIHKNKAARKKSRLSKLLKKTSS